MIAELNTSKGTIRIQLHPKEAPLTVENFIYHIKQKHYDQTIFHRVIKNFMIQGGGFNNTMLEKKTTHTIQNEADNGLKNKKGSVAMARTSDPHSAKAQFFINTADNNFLDFRAPSDDKWGYCVFGTVIEGMDIVNQIQETETGTRLEHQDVPIHTVLIEKAIIVE